MFDTNRSSDGAALLFVHVLCTNRPSGYFSHRRCKCHREPVLDGFFLTFATFMSRERSTWRTHVSLRQSLYLSVLDTDPCEL